MFSGRVLSPLLRNSSYILTMKFMSQSTVISTLPVRFVSTRKVMYICGDQQFVGSGKLGDTLLDVVINNDLPLDGFGACEGTLACCTCHIILSPEHFERVDRINPAGEEELDLLDLAPELSDHSRLGCQVNSSLSACRISKLYRNRKWTHDDADLYGGAFQVQIDSGDPELLVVNVPVQKRDARDLN
ncbi:hypothetical protein DICVIV_05167 [Dictyocaulus viviparus]|uniref:2Fe-2S iron-sulfur cluster binding domain protein n=1 Tax=Dictyocaulus viviparus TaxID=29172 RepID=A0A0D8Y2B8_DICVI|nr:hypothetical protein DICVIV_05167 [Dictyocaulus viviparus]